VRRGRQPAGRRYQTPILPPGFVTTAAVRLYLRPASPTALLQPGNVLPMIAGGRMNCGYFLLRAVFPGSGRQQRPPLPGGAAPLLYIM